MQLMTGRVATPTERPVLAVTESPTIEELRVWWEAMQGDDLRVAYADSFPPTLSHFRREVAQGEKMLLLGRVDGQVAGAVWLHDLLHRHHCSASAGWIGCYFLPPYRGHVALQLWQAARQCWEDAGTTHFFTAVHVANRRSQAFITRGACFHRVGRFPDFTLFHGQPVDVLIYTLHAQDTALAWELATARAARQMPRTCGPKSAAGAHIALPPHRPGQLPGAALEHRSSIPATGPLGALAPVGEARSALRPRSGAKEARSALRPRSGAREGWVRGERERGKTRSTDCLTDVLD